MPLVPRERELFCDEPLCAWCGAPRKSDSETCSKECAQEWDEWTEDSEQDRRDEEDDKHDREQYARELGMGLGVEAYNDAMGF